MTVVLETGEAYIGLRADDMGWQCALNEGWPDYALPVRVPPHGTAIVPTLPDNVVDLRAWRVAHRSTLRAVPH